MARPPRVAAPSVFAVTCDAEGRIESIVRDELGIAKVGAPFVELVDAHAGEKAQTFLDTVRERGAVHGWELTVEEHGRVRPIVFAGVADGSRIVIVGGAMPGRDRRPRGEADPYETLSQVNNELANAQRELTRQKSELERINEEKNRFVGMAAHDLRNPLSVILNYAQLVLQDEITITAESAELLREIAGSSRFMLHIIDDLLDVSTIEAGKVELRLAELDPVQTVERNLTRNRLLAERKNIRIELTIDGPVPPIRTDPGKLDQILNNLVMNAIKYSDPGTVVAVGVTAKGDKLSIAVCDRGRGIPAAELTTIFKPFARLSATGTAGERSTGLGLTIVHRLAEVLRGRIRVESEVGKGSTITLELPLA